MDEVEELYEALEEAREADQVASACVLYEEILTREEVENVISSLLYVTDLIDLGNFGQAESTLRRLVDLCDDPASEELLHFTFATLQEKRGRFEEAEKDYRQAHKVNPQRGDLLLMAANMAFLAGESSKAEYLVREALKSQCDLAEAHGNLGYYLASQRRFVEAKAAFEEVLKIEPANDFAIEWIEDLSLLTD